MKLVDVKFDAAGLVPVIVQDAHSGEVLTLAYANAEALEHTLATKQSTFYSRSRQELWIKGLTSGNTQQVLEVVLDCDQDAVLYKVIPSGPACHTGAQSCFHNPVFPSPPGPLPLRGEGEKEASLNPPSPRLPDEPQTGTPSGTRERGLGGEGLGAVLEKVYATIQQRIRDLPEGSYVAKMHQAGLDRILKKIGEEAGEVIIAAKNHSPQELSWEASDLLFHLLLTLAEQGLTPDDLAKVLWERHR